MRAPSQATSAFCSRSRSDHSSSRSACENALLPYSDDSSATTSSVTAAASAATAALRTARSMSRHASCATCSSRYATAAIPDQPPRRAPDRWSALLATVAAVAGRVVLGLSRAHDRRGGVRVDAVGGPDLDVDETRGAERVGELPFGERAGDAAGPLHHVRARGVVHVGVGDDVGDREAAAGAQDTGGLAQHPGLVGGEVDDAVGDDDVHRVVRERDVLDVALDELDIVDAGLGGVPVGEGEHLVGHVQADRAAGGPDAAGADEDVRAGTGAEVEDRLALVQFGDGGRPAAAERGLDRRGGGAGGLVAVEGGAVDLDAVGVGRAHVLVDAATRGGGAAATTGRSLGDAVGGGGVALADDLADVGVLGQLSHAVSSFSASGRT